MPDDDENLVIPWWGLVSLVFLVLTVLGFFVSPIDQVNQSPILLMPDVKAAEDYRQSIRSWGEQIKTLDAEITTILSGKYGNDIFASSREAQKITDKAIKLAQEIEGREVPTAALPAREVINRCIRDYLEAARVMLLWVNAPNQANHNEAQNRLQIARNTYSELKRSQWWTEPLSK